MIKVPKVLHLSTHHEPCGIGLPQEKSVEALNKNGGSINEFYPLSLNKIKVMDDVTRKEELERIQAKAKDYDIVHIQHEFGLFNRKGQGFGEIIEVLKSAGVAIVVSIHTAPELMLVPGMLKSKTPRGIAGYLRRKYKNKSTIELKLKPFALADKIITFNNFTKEQLINIVGVNPKNIVKTMLPVPESTSEKNTRIKKLMKADQGDFILCTSGFINQYKGFDHAVKALKFLPDNYKLAILGGINPDSGDPIFYNHLCDLIVSLNLEKRIYISGYIDQDDELAELMQGCDVALYPYNPEYYKMASSGAINKAIGCSIPVVAYLTGSLNEINQIVPDTVVFTDSPNYYELARSTSELDREKVVFNEKKYTSIYSHEQTAIHMTNIYRELLEAKS